MNFYDEEIHINGPSMRNLSKIRVKSLSSSNDSFDTSEATPITQTNRLKSAQSTRSNRPSEANERLRGSAKAIDEYKPEDLDFTKSSFMNAVGELSDIESDDETTGGNLAQYEEEQEQEENKLTVTIEKIQALNISSSMKDIMQYVMNYTPQEIDIPYQLQPFVPYYVPAVGDVDAFIKPTLPEILPPEVHTELSKLGLHILDEPSGTQSDPSLLNMKLNSVFSTGNANSQRLVPPVAKSVKDIDKWITEVEQIHALRSAYKPNTQRDIEALVANWPSNFRETYTVNRVQNAYQNDLSGEVSLLEYIRELSEIFNLEGIQENMQIEDYVPHVYTLFCMYLVSHKAWE